MKKLFMTYPKICSIMLAVPIVFFALLACETKTVNSEVAQPVAEPTPVNKEPITIAAVGDIMMASPFPNDSRMPPNDGADLFTPFKSVLAAADITFGNLEGPIVDTGISAKCRPGSTRCFAFRTPTRYGRYLKEAGFDVMSVANNHAGDFGETGRVSTQKVLDEQGIKYAGSLQPLATTAYLESHGKRVAFIGFGHNNGMPSINDLDGARRLVTEAGKKADIVVVSFHGGAEGTNAQRVPQRSEIFLGENRGNLPLFARTVIDAGADLVIGHGPHVMRGMEIYKDRLVMYSLGNFCTYGWFQLAGETALTAVVEATIDAEGKFISGRIYPGKQEGRGIPVPDEAKQAVPLLRNLSTADFPTSAPKIADDGSITPK